MLAEAAHIATRDAVPILTCAGGPQVRMLDGRRAGLDESGLREWARAYVGAQGAPHVTRSYRYPYALVAWHGARVGIDIERIEPYDAAFAQSICMPSETVDWASASNRDEYLSSMWSSKEAIAKALGDALSYDPRRLEAPMLWTGGQAGAWRSAQLPVVKDHVAWICWWARGEGVGRLGGE
jgi:phosphopantetheinyl transferase